MAIDLRGTTEMGKDMAKGLYTWKMDKNVSTIG